MARIKNHSLCVFMRIVYGDSSGIGGPVLGWTGNHFY